MKEIVLTHKKNGMLVLLLLILLYLLSLAGIIGGGFLIDAGHSPVVFILGMLIFCTGWILIPGLKVLKPQ